MEIINNKEIVLSIEEIEKIINKYLVKKNVVNKKDNVKISFNLKDIAEDDDTGPYRPHFIVNNVTITTKG